MTSDGSALSGILRAAEQGATILTANQRTSRTLRDAYDRRQKQANVSAWRTPDILPWSGFLHRLWNELLFAGLVDGVVLLNGAQERTIWEKIVNDEGGQKLLNAGGGAATARKSWQLVRQYEIPLDDAMFARRAETAAFLRWASRFQSECRRNNWIDEASLPGSILPHLRAKRVVLRKKIWLIGFDHFTPQQQALIDAMTAGGAQCENVPMLRGKAATVRVASAEDGGDELRAAAVWARHRLEENPKSRLGVVSFALEQQRERVDRVFLEALHPGQLVTGTGGRCYEISVGTLLAEVPVVASALLAAKLACDLLSLDEAGWLLRSPYVAGAETELTARARLDCKLRERRQLQFSLHQLREAVFSNGRCPALLEGLKAAERAWNPRPARQSPREWLQAVSGLLKAVGWPAGERGLNSAEFQAANAWNEVLAELASLDAVEPAMDAARFFVHLQQAAAETTFQPEKFDAPVQIMGALEAAGAELDALWVMGMHDDAWPAGARPDPFIPLTLQLKYGVPHSSAEVEFQYAEVVRDRLLYSADDVVFSWPKNDGDTVLRPSPMLNAGRMANTAQENAWEVAGEPVDTWGSALLNSCVREQFEDENGPAATEGSDARGGTATLKSQAACPFMAFAQWRLGASEPESPEPGLDARQRGVIIHRAIEFVWKELKCHSELVRRRDEWQELVSGCVWQAIDATNSAGNDDWEHTLAEIEHARVSSLLLDLLKQEAGRAPFTVELEKERTVELGGLRFRMKLDRIDRLEDGLGCVLIDYKTGEARISSWAGARPEEPQLPAYAATTKDKVAGVAFATIRAGDVGFAGYLPDARLVPGATDYRKTVPGKEGLSLGEVVSDWKRIVEKLAREHREGCAAAAPLIDSQTCGVCPVTALCRIAELRNRGKADLAVNPFKPTPGLNGPQRPTPGLNGARSKSTKGAGDAD